MSEEIVKCPHCGAINKGHDLTTGDKVLCSSCGKELVVACYVEARPSADERKFSDGFVATGKWGLVIGVVLGAVVGGASGAVTSGPGGGLFGALVWGLLAGIGLGLAFGLVGGFVCRAACKKG
jgi:hypothetical protein